MKMKTKLSFIIASILLFFSTGMNSTYSQSCGPGPHWIDECSSGGPDIMESGALVGVNFTLTNCNLPAEQNITLSGPVTVQRLGSHDIAVLDGLCPATVDGHLDVIPTEIISMNLTGSGFTLIIGPSAAPELQHSFGYVVEDPADNTLGCSFFDVWFKIITPGGTLYNQTPLRLEATIDRVPPTTTYIPTEIICLALYTSPIYGEGVHMANLVQAQHNVYPYIIPTLSQWGLIILALVLLTIGAIYIFRK
jgi:hypothetical protein